MGQSLNALASQIMADASSNGNIRSDLNREHVCDAIFQMAASLIRTYLNKGQQLHLPSFCTTLPFLPVQTADFTFGGLLASEHVYQHPDADPRAFGLPIEQLRQCVKLPAVMRWGTSTALGAPAIDYLGSIDGRVKLTIYTGEDYKFAAHERYTGREPFAWVSENVAWLFSPVPLPWQQVVLRAVLDDQRESAEFGRLYDENETRLAWPLDFINEISKALSGPFSSLYGRAAKGQPADGNLPPI